MSGYRPLAIALQRDGATFAAIAHDWIGGRINAGQWMQAQLSFQAALDALARKPPERAAVSIALLDALDTIEQDAGWLHDHVPNYSPDGVATLRDIAREIARSAQSAKQEATR